MYIATATSFILTADEILFISKHANLGRTGEWIKWLFAQSSRPLMSQDAARLSLSEKGFISILDNKLSIEPIILQLFRELETTLGNSVSPEHSSEYNVENNKVKVVYARYQNQTDALKIEVKKKEVS